MTNTPPQPAGSIDWGKVLEEQENDPGFAPLPAGPYEAFVKEAHADRASTGSQMIKLTFEISSGPYATRYVWTNIVFKTDSPGSMRFAMRKLRALGIDVAWLAAENPPLEQVASKLVGAHAAIKVNQREWNDTIQNDVESISSVAGTPTEASGPSIPSPSEPTLPAPNTGPSIPTPDTTKLPGDPF